MGLEDYWKEVEALADTLLPIPPTVCLDKNGVVIVTARCLQCPMEAQCKLKRSRYG